MLFKNTINTSSLELLKGLQSEKPLKDFYLAGGTSLALQIGHRKSIDLDLFTQSDFNLDQLLEFLEQKYDLLTDYTSKNTIRGSINNIKVDFISHKYPMVKDPVIENSLKLFSVEDIAAMKQNAIAGDGTRSKDFIDLYFILKSYTVDKILDFYKIKYSKRNLFHVIKSIIYFDDISTQDWPDLLIEKNLTIEQVTGTIEKKVNDFLKQQKL